jgi:ABC-2 type transport system permease protein
MMALTIVFMSMYSIIAQDAEYFLSLLEGFDPRILKAIGMQIETFTSELGYYSFVLNYISLIAAIQATNLGLSLLSKEETDKTADFLMTKPVSRSRILTSKLFSGLSAILATFLIFMATSSVMINLIRINPISMRKFFMSTFTVLFVQVMFLAIGVFISVLSRKIKSVISVSLAVTFGFFAIAALGDSSGEKPLHYLTPFKYFDVLEIVRTGRYQPTFIVLGSILVIVLIAGSYFIYLSKDIHAV